MEIIVIILLIAMVVVMYGIFQNLFGSSEEITVIEEIPSPPKDLKEVMAQMQSEKLFKQAVQIKKEQSNEIVLDNIQQEIDILVNELYAI